MVTFFNAGRLANFLYQFCAAYSYSRKHSLEFSVPYIERDQRWHPVYLKNLRNGNFNTVLPSVFVYEKQHSYHELEFKEEWRGINIYLQGYFQSPLYFKDYIDEIRSLLPFQYETEAGICGIHCRRGDFLLYPDKHILPPDEYYSRALWYIMAIVGLNLRFRIYSDDITYCKTYFTKERFGVEFEYSEGKDELGDFESLMNCEAVICAASTFSVLAATLSPQQNKIVVCTHESNFFGPVGAHLDLSTMYPEHFHRIKY